MQKKIIFFKRDINKYLHLIILIDNSLLQLPKEEKQVPLALIKAKSLIENLSGKPAIGAQE